MDPNFDNNDVSIIVQISTRNKISLTDFTIRPNTTQYDTEENTAFGDKVTAVLRYIGTGPTTIPTATVTFYLPGILENGDPFYYLYPSRAFIPPELATSEAVVMCSGINPENVAEFNGQQRRRRRRRFSSSGGGMDQLVRMIRGQDNEEQEHTIEKRRTRFDCGIDRQSCVPLQCILSNVTADPSGISLELEINNRFFRSQDDDFQFFIHATYSVESDFFPADEESLTSTNLIVHKFRRGSDSAIPIWVYVISILLGLIIIAIMIILIVLLVVCLRRRTKKKIKKIRRDTERRRSLNRAASAGVAAVSLDTKPELEGSVVKPPVEETDEKPKPPPPSLDEKPEEAGEGDPDETEL